MEVNKFLDDIEVKEELELTDENDFDNELCDDPNKVEILFNQAEKENVIEPDFVYVEHQQYSSVKTEVSFETDEIEIKAEEKIDPSLLASSTNPCKLVPNCGLKYEVNLKHFGIEEEAEVLEIPSDLISNESLIKSLYGKVYKKKKKSFKCSNCMKTFKALCDIKRHLLIHTGEKAFECMHCISKFSRKENLDRHLLQHAGVKAFQCSLCTSAFSQKQSLDRHVFAYHDLKTYSCSVCSKGFKDKHTLIVHERIHTGEKPYQCSYCAKSFTYRSTYKNHIDVIHEGKSHFNSTQTKVKLFCEVCGESFISRSGLKGHLKLHELKQGSRSLEFKCEVCDKMFFTIGNKNRHLKSHTGQKNHQCEECEKSYTEKRQLENHKEIVHQGKRDYFCSVCPKSFTRSNSLNAHMRLHTGQEVLQCEFCTSTYKEKRNLMNHVKKQHKCIEQGHG
eukprot:GFUD01018771.1.p1 GENE.GFUD01018771.1~~GFUD01018771.1.p1  ORF type:complete len:448 (+),score=64.03 GFUD01018771.1:73-1416(+)